MHTRQHRCAHPPAIRTRSSSPMPIPITLARRGAICPVYAGEKSWLILTKYGIRDRCLVCPRLPTSICGMTFEAFPVQAPTLGYRIGAGAVHLFYVPDLVFIDDRSAALAGVMLYITYRATLARPCAEMEQGPHRTHADTHPAGMEQRGFLKSLIETYGNRRHLSISPITMSIEPTIAGISAIRQPRQISLVTDRLQKLEERARTRRGTASLVGRPTT